MPIGNGSAHATLLALVDLVRDYAHAEGLDFYARTWKTADGTVRVGYLTGVMVRVTFAGDAPTRHHLLPHDWPA